jgi:hypothetical protein
MGRVYEAQDLRLGRTVALKVLNDIGSTDGTERLLREARAASAFEHPNAVVVFDVGVEQGMAYLAMELVRGRGLREYIGDPSVGLGQRLRWLVDVARALDAAHRAGLVHRDIKPENLMVRADGTVKVLDFGIARAHSARIDPTARTQLPLVEGVGTLTATGAFVGTAAYAAPEQLLGEGVDGRTDQFAWAVTAYELCTGKPPWRGTPVALISQIISKPPVALRDLVPGIPPEVEAALLRALEKRADARFATMADLADTLEPFADASGRPVSSGASALTPRALSGDTAAPGPSLDVPARRKRTVRLVGAAAFAVLCVGAFRAIRPSPQAVKAPAVKPMLSALECSSAKVAGSAPDAQQLSLAIGVGACARLATELGVDWAGGLGASKLEVVAHLDAGETRVELRLLGVTASGKGRTPIAAEDAAVAAFAPHFAVAVPTPAAIAAWGAKDATSARAIERAWRRFSLRFEARPDLAALALADRYPDSAWSQMEVANTSSSTTRDYFDAINAGLARSEALPPARRLAIHGYLLSLRSQADGPEGIRLAASAYAQAPNDPDVIALHALALLQWWREDEALAIIEHLASRFPTRSLRALRFAIAELPIQKPDRTRDQALIRRLTAILPEALGWSPVIDALTAHGLVAEARRHLQLSERLGLVSGVSSAIAFSRARIELAALDPQAARQAASTLLGDPSARSSARGASVLIAAYWLQGRAVDAQSTQRHEIERRRGAGDMSTAMRHAMTDLQIRRWLNEPLPDAAALNQLSAALPGLRAEPATFLAASRTELALAALRSSDGRDKQAAEAALAALEQDAEAQRDERWLHDGLLLETLPLARALRGDRVAAERWRSTERAPFIVRRFLALDAALALEASGDIAGAEAAYLLAQDRQALEFATFDFMAANVRLGQLYRKQGKPAQRAAVDAVVTKLWAQADAGLRERVLRMR